MKVRLEMGHLTPIETEMDFPGDFPSREIDYAPPLTTEALDRPVSEFSAKRFRLVRVEGDVAVYKLVS